MSMKKSLLATSLMAMAALSSSSSYGAPERKVSQTILTNKQKKARNKNKSAKKARKNK